MMVANSFDMWQKDAFFSAAEEVQESADVMESAYRMWIREKREGLKAEDLNDLSKELQTALGTAKWQLEEFERAVRMSHGHQRDDITASRHTQFVAAIESQISRVEAALRESFNEDGNQPLRWVNLDKEECDDLATFLSGVPRSPQLVKDNFFTSDRKHFDDVGTSNQNSEFIIDVEEKEIPEVRDDILSQMDKTTGTRRTWSSPNFGALRIVIADDEGQKNNLTPIVATPKEKRLKPFFWMQRCGKHPRMWRSINLFSQVGGLQRQLQSPLQLQFSCSIQLKLALMLSIFLIVPFLLYST